MTLPTVIRVEGLLGRGAVADVYRAVATDDPGWRLALKRLHTVTPDAVARLRDEAWLLDHLNVPGIPGGLLYAELDGAPCLAMQYVPGVSAGELLRRLGPLPVSAAVAVVGVAARVLAALHETPGPDGAPLRLVHRGLKPDDVLLDGDGGVYLVDLGSATARFSDRAAVTAGIRVRGDPRRPPEAGTALDPRLDSYALGALLVELLTGAPPPEGSWLAAEHHRRLADAMVQRGLGPGVIALVERWMAHAVRERPLPIAIAAELDAMPAGSPGLAEWARLHVRPRLTARERSIASGGGLVGRTYRPDGDRWTRTDRATPAPPPPPPQRAPPATTRFIRFLLSPPPPPGGPAPIAPTQPAPPRGDLLDWASGQGPLLLLVGLLVMGGGLFGVAAVIGWITMR